MRTKTPSSPDPDQLALFEGMKPKKLTPHEFKTQCTLVDIIRGNIDPGWRFTHIPLGEYRTPATARKLKRMGVNAGWPDFIFVGPAQRVVFLEWKRRGGRLSDDQISMLKHILTCGHVYMTYHDVKLAVAELVTRGILRGVHVQ